MTGEEAAYLKWASNHAAGMQAAASKTARHRLSGETLSRIRRETRERFPCKVRDCKRTAHKGSLCKWHWDLVPHEDKIELQLAVMDAQLRTAAKYHRKFLRYFDVQRSIRGRV